MNLQEKSIQELVIFVRVGLTKDQKDRQVKNVQMDLVLKKGASNLTQGY